MIFSIPDMPVPISALSLSVTTATHSSYFSSDKLASRKTPGVYLLQTVPQPKQQIKAAPEGISSHPASLALPQWQTFPAGAYDAITDVPGIKVGHVTYRQDAPDRIRTGVTAIVPDAVMLTHGQGNLATTGYRASAVAINGNGELTGTAFINEFGALNAPILLTNTRSVGVIVDGVDAYFDKTFPGQWSCQLPVVGECYDGFFNTIGRNIIPASAAETAITQAVSGFVPQGQIGAGTGMRSFGLHAGIGSASRIISLNGKSYTLGVLVNMNHSHLSDLNPVIRQQLEARFGLLEVLKTKDDGDAAHLHPVKSPRQGSIQIVIATDLPLSTKELQQVASRAALGVGNTGSTIATTSGDFVIAFSTANPIVMNDTPESVFTTSELHPDVMTPIFKATVEAVMEAQTNALVASHS